MRETQEMDDLTIVVVYADDLTAVQREEKQHLQVRCFSDIPYEELVEDFIALSLASVLAYRGGMIVGCASVYKRVITYEGQPIVLGGFGGTCTCPELRGRGIGTAVSRAALELLRNEGCDLAFLAVDASKGTARFYERLGFVLLGRPFTFVDVHGAVKHPTSDGVGMIAPVCSPALFEHVLHGRSDLALGPEQGYW